LNGSLVLRSRANIIAMFGRAASGGRPGTFAHQGPPAARPDASYL